jgi:hypothetical protein
VFVVAVLLAYGLYWLRARRKPAEFDSRGDVWINSIGTRPADKHPYVGLQLNDGSFVEGALHAFTFGAEPGKRDSALSSPIRFTPTDETEAQWVSEIDRVVVPESKIEYITIKFTPTENVSK